MWPARPRKQKRPRLWWAEWDQGLAQSTQPRLFSGSLGGVEGGELPGHGPPFSPWDTRLVGLGHVCPRS